MNKATLTLVAAGFGAGLMFVFDPDKGRRRRAIARDKMRHLQSRSSEMLGKAAHDLRNRTLGIVAETSAVLRVEDVTDDRLVARVRSRMGHVVSHPHAIEVAAHDGTVVLSGPILASEASRLVDCVRGIKGVARVENNLELHERPDVPLLYGGPHRGGPIGWPPAKRLLVGATGGVMAAYGAIRGDIVGATLGTLGAGALTRALSQTSPNGSTARSNGHAATFPSTETTIASEAS